jgi:hypothetical protein
MCKEAPTGVNVREGRSSEQLIHWRSILRWYRLDLLQSIVRLHQPQKSSQGHT